MKDWHWLTRTQVAEAIGTSPRNFDERVKPRLSRKQMKGRGATLRYDVRAVVRTWVDMQAEKFAEEDPLLGGGGESEALELYRHEKFIEQKRKNDEAAKKICDMGKLLTAVLPACGALRTALEKVRHRFGPDAGQLCDEGVDAFEAAAKKALEAETTSDK